MNDLTRNTRSMLCLTGLLLGWAASGHALAEKIYESVDAEGEVTFSDEPPSDAGAARQIELQPGPTPAEVQQSRQQLKNMENMANEAGSAGQSQATQPAAGSMPASEGSAEGETNVYVEGGYADERYRDERVQEGVATDDRYRDERVRQATPAQESNRGERYGEEGLRGGAGGVARPAGRVR